MEILKAKENLVQTITLYATKISDLGVKCVADVYFTDEKGLSTSAEQNELSDSLFGSITVCSEDATDETGKCGFDILLQITKKKDIDDTQTELSLSAFKDDIEAFIDELAVSDDKNEFIKAQSEKEKAEYAEKFEKFNKDIKRLQTISVCLFGIVMLLVIVGVFALISGF